MLQCDRCKSRRADLVDSKGRLIGRAYQYDEGYGHMGYKEFGGIAAFKQEARRALFERLAKRRKANGG
jgi:hypothetical protein